MPSYIKDILVKGERHHNIFSGKPQPLNQDYFKTVWRRFGDVLRGNLTCLNKDKHYSICVSLVRCVVGGSMW